MNSKQTVRTNPEQLHSTYKLFMHQVVADQRYIGTRSQSLDICGAELRCCGSTAAHLSLTEVQTKIAECKQSP